MSVLPPLNTDCRCADAGETKQSDSVYVPWRWNVVQVERAGCLGARIAGLHFTLVGTGKE